MSKLKKLAGETVLYGLGNLVPRFLNFLLLPIHTSFFHAAEYGVFTYLMSVVALLNVVYSFGMETTYFRFATKPNADAKKIFNIAQTTVVLISASLTLIFILFSRSWASLLSVQGHANYIVWLALIMFIDNVVSIPFARLRLEKKPLQFAAFRISNVLIQIALTVYFLYINFDPTIGIAYIILTNLIANAFYLLFFLKTFLRWKLTFDKEIFFSMLHYSFPIMLTGLAGMMNEFFSRIALDKWLPENFYSGKTSAFAVGVFGACYKFSMVMSLTVAAFRLAAEPFFFSNAAEKNSPALFVKVNHYFIIVCCIILLTVSINLDVLKIFLKQKEYWDGLAIVPPLLLGYLFLGVYYNFTVWFKLTDKTYYGTIITAGGVILTLILNFILIPVAGFYGSSWATAIVYGAMMIACYLIGQKYYPIPYSIGIDSLYIVATYLLIIGVNSMSFHSSISTIGFHLLVVILFIGIIYLIEKSRLAKTHIRNR